MSSMASSTEQNPRYSQSGDGGSFRMLSRKTGKCQCHGGATDERIYRWHAFWYCTTCLHSIGINAAGNYCTAKQYAAAWRKLAA